MQVCTGFCEFTDEKYSIQFTTTESLAHEMQNKRWRGMKKNLDVNFDGKLDGKFLLKILIAMVDYFSCKTQFLLFNSQWTFSANPFEIRQKSFWLDFYGLSNFFLQFWIKIFWIFPPLKLFPTRCFVSSHSQRQFVQKPYQLSSINITLSTLLLQVWITRDSKSIFTLSVMSSFKCRRSAERASNKHIDHSEVTQRNVFNALCSIHISSLLHKFNSPPADVLLLLFDDNCHCLNTNISSCCPLALSWKHQIPQSNYV